MLVNDYAGPIAVEFDTQTENPYENLEELKDDIDEILVKNNCSIIPLISYSKPLNKEEDLVLALEMNNKVISINTYVYFNKSFFPWIECPINLSDFKSLEELVQELNYHFEYDYALALHEKQRYGDDEDYYYERSKEMENM